MDRELARRVDEKLAAWARTLPPRDVVIRRPTELSKLAAALTQYGKYGTGLDHEAAYGALDALVEALYRRPIDDRAPWPAGDDAGTQRDPFGDPDDPITCVILAALARRALSAGAKYGLLVNTRWLAALASLAVSRVHQLRSRLRRERHQEHDRLARRGAPARGARSARLRRSVDRSVAHRCGSVPRARWRALRG